jgi:hypothetical protein
VGETCKPLEVRVNEHKRNWQQIKIKKEEGKEADTISSLLACHAIEQDHQDLWDYVKILAKEPNTKRRKIHEAAAMYLEEEVISQPSCELAALWNPRRKRGREMEEEPAEMERGKMARIQGQTVARVRATEYRAQVQSQNCSETSE